MRNNKNSIGENIILFLAAIGVFAIIGGFAGWWSGSDDEEYYDYDYSPSSSYSSHSSSSYNSSVSSGSSSYTPKSYSSGKYGSIIFLMGLAPNVLGYRHPAAILDRSKNKCCGLITDGEELKNNQLCFSVDTTVLHLFSDLSRTCPRTSGGWVPPLALTPKNNRSVSFLVA